MRIFGLILFLLCLSLTTQSSASPYFETNFPLGKAEAQKSNWKSAVKIWKSCLKASPTQLEKLKLYFSLAKAYAKLNRKDLALKCAKRAQKLAPHNTKVAELVRRLNPDFSARFQEGRDSFEAALDNERLQDGTGEDLFKEAARIFKEAIGRSHELAFSHYAYGTCLIELKADKELALKHLKSSYELDANNPGVLYRLGEIALEEGNTTEAVNYLEKGESSGKASPELAAALVRAWGRAQKKVPTTKIVDLVSMAASANVNLVLGLADEFNDSSIRGQINSVVQRAQAAARKASSYTAQSSSSSSNAATPTKEKQQEKPKERERTATEKNYDRYNEVRYQQYLTHLNRLQSGKPSSWSGAIPKRPEKEKK